MELVIAAAIIWSKWLQVFRIIFLSSSPETFSLLQWPSENLFSPPVSLLPKIEADDWELPAPLSPVSASLPDYHDFTGRHRCFISTWECQNGCTPVWAQRSLTRDCVWGCWDLNTHHWWEYQRRVCQQVLLYLVLCTTQERRNVYGTVFNSV